MTDGQLTKSAMPTSVRLELDEHYRELTASLARPHRDNVRAIIAHLATMPSRPEDDIAKSRFAVEQYIDICADVPEWALEWAMRAFLKNEAGGASPFRPTAGELRAFAMRRVQDVRDERHKIEKVLNAKIAPSSKPMDPQRRKELADMLRNACRGA